MNSEIRMNSMRQAKKGNKVALKCEMISFIGVYKTKELSAPTSAERFYKIKLLATANVKVLILIKVES